MPIARVRFLLGDTNLPETPGSGGSRTAASVGSAVKQAALAARAQLVELALRDPRSPLHGRDAGDIAAGEGALWVAQEPAKRDSFSDILARNNRAQVAARVDAKEPEERKGYSLHSFGAQFAEVRVDEPLARIRVSRMVGAFAAGRILNAKMARSQLMGGMVWGIGMALHEHTVRDLRTGRVVTRDLADYHVPVNADVPAVDVIMIDEDDPHVNAIGAKGIGELGITGAAAAIANAVYHATGVRVRDLPITPDKLPDKLIGGAA
jgi:xanthine dehydrogenase YagR molybdenum-binding subunit